MGLLPKFVTKCLVIGLLVCATQRLLSSINPGDNQNGNITNKNNPYKTINNNNNVNRAHSKSKSPRIALLSSHVPTNFSNPFSDIERDLNQNTTFIEEKYFDYIINKKCYSDFWGYDFILNETSGFGGQIYDATRYGPFWLHLGHWQRVPHIRDRLLDYDWILYSDLDYAITNHSTPLQYFLQAWEQLLPRNLSNQIGVFVPSGDEYLFSSYAIMIRNNPFGHAVLRHWEAYGRGLCPSGNYRASAMEREHRQLPKLWRETDQPGLWYALIKATEEFTGRLCLVQPFQCNNETGFINGLVTDMFFAFRWYFGRYLNYTLGTGEEELSQMQDNQYIVFSKAGNSSQHGIYDGSWGIHRKVPSSEWDSQMKHELEECKQRYGCYARYDEQGRFQFGCNVTSEFPLVF